VFCSCFGFQFNIPSIDYFFGQEWEKNHNHENSNHLGDASGPGQSNQQNKTISTESLVLTDPPPVAPAGNQFGSRMMIFSPRQLQKSNVGLADPAAVSMNQRHLLMNLRDKMV
jgi:hypothetical protein